MDKLKIAICDDEAADLAQAIALVEDYELDQQFEISILDSIIVKSSIYKNDVKRIKNNYYKKPLFSSWQRI